MTHLEEFIVSSAGTGIELQGADGAMPAGHNGPHDHKMTPARNTGHWSILFAHAYAISGERRFEQSCRRCLDLLVSPALRPMHGAIWHRKHNGRNSMNGLIGQAWSMEALYYGWQILKDPRYRDIGLQLADMHMFDKHRSLWYQLDLDGTALALEFTLNQQVWFSAMVLLLAGNDHPELVSKVWAFLGALPAQVAPRRSGLLRGSILVSPSTLGRLAEQTRQAFDKSRHRRKTVEIGYHIFSLVGLAHIYQTMPDHSLFGTKLVRRALLAAYDSRLMPALRDNVFGFAYNVPGFELPYVVQTMGCLIGEPDTSELSSRYIRQQIANHLDRRTGMLSLNTTDPMTLAARVYEVCRLIPFASGVDASVAQALGGSQQ